MTFNARFTEHVLDCFRRGDYAISAGFMGPEYIVNKARMERAVYSWADSPNGPDEWGLYLESWFFGLFPRVTLIRGPERFKLRLTRHEHRGLAIIFQAVFAERKALAKQAKLDYKRRQELAYYANGVDLKGEENGLTVEIVSPMQLSR